MADLWPRAAQIKRTAIRPGVLERVPDARDDFVTKRLAVDLGQCCLGIARMLLALRSELIDERGAIAFKPGIGRSFYALRLRRLGNGGVKLALGGRPRVTGSFGVMFAMFQCVRSRIAAMVVRVVPISLLIWPSLTSG